MSTNTPVSLNSKTWSLKNCPVHSEIWPRIWRYNFCVVICAKLCMLTMRWYSSPSSPMKKMTSVHRPTIGTPSCPSTCTPSCPPMRTPSQATIRIAPDCVKDEPDPLAQSGVRWSASSPSQTWHSSLTWRTGKFTVLRRGRGRQRQCQPHFSTEGWKASMCSLDGRMTKNLWDSPAKFHVHHGSTDAQEMAASQE